MKLYCNSVYAGVFVSMVLLLVAGPGFIPAARGDSVSEVIVEERINGEIRSTRITPYRGNIPARDFYNYYAGNPNTGFEITEGLVLIPFESPSGNIGLIVVAGNPGSHVGGRARMEISGLPNGSRVSLYDDPPERDPEDSYSFAPPEGEFLWNWDPGSADGAIISGLSGGFELSINLKELENVNNARMVSGSRKEPEVVALNEEAKIKLSGVLDTRTPEPHFSCSQPGYVGEAVRFDASSTSSPFDGIVQYGWDFDGDGHYSYVSHNPVAERTFQDSGTYNVRLRITDRTGKKTVREKKIEVVKRPLEATRELSSRKVTPGGTVLVTVRLKARQAISGLGLDEEIPSGWEVSYPNSGEAAWKSSSNQWLLKKELEPGEAAEITYRLHAPSVQDPESPETRGEIDLFGEASSANPKTYSAVTGDSRIQLTRSPDGLLSLAHYDPRSEELDFSLSDEITDGQLQAAIKAWKNGSDLSVLGQEELSFDFLRRALLYHQKGVGVTEELSRPASPDLEVTRKIDTQLPDGLLYLSSDSPLARDEANVVEFRIKVTLSPANRTLMGVSLKERIPESWELVPENRAGLVSKAETRQWIIEKPLMAGEEFEMRYRVRVPIDDPGQNPRINGELNESWSGSSLSIRGEKEVNPISTLPVKIAISRWNVETGEIDLNTDNYITESQAEKAISFWVTDEAVPDTGGKKLKFSTVKEIMALQLRGKSVLGEYQLD
ncbi:hypothetical protein KGY71_03720 [Candidatus Bipolaricaulota bacterium]|nr:hypothetical protein [Candidatus Bipolaricaulota bacterium]